jgi:hypothetical protein
MVAHCNRILQWGRKIRLNSKKKKQEKVRIFQPKRIFQVSRWKVTKKKHQGKREF